MPLALSPETMVSVLGDKAALLSAAKNAGGATPSAKLRNVVEVRIWPYVQGMVNRHLGELLETHTIMSGERPAENEQEALAARAEWDSELDDAFRATLDDWVPNVISVSEAERLTVDARLDDKTKAQQTAEQLTKAIVGGPWSLDDLAAKLGITADEMTGLSGPVPVVGALPESTTMGATVNDAQREMVVTVLREFLLKPEGDLLDAMTWLGEMAQPDDTIAFSSAQHLGYQAPLAAVPVMRALSGADGWMDALLAEAAKPAPDPKANRMAAKAEKADKAKFDNDGKPGSKRGAKECAPAIKAAFEVLLDTTDMTEASLSTMLGISRAQLNNIRKGERGYEPNDPAKKALMAAFDVRIDKLGDARVALYKLVDVAL